MDKKNCLIIFLIAAAMFSFTGTQAQLDASEKTTVLKSADSPTGYYVTFRYKDTKATRVRIYGEWKFSDEAHASRWTSLEATPEQWKNGYFNYTAGQWLTSDMTLNSKTGVWSYTIPLPSGTFNYCFYIGGADTSAVGNVNGATRTWDPSNPPLLYDYNAQNMNRDEQLSNIFVPYDKDKQSHSLDLSAEAPRSSEKGKAFYATVKYKDSIVEPFGIYLPYGYDAKRAEPYPIMVLVHGMGGVESSWFNLGAADDILDNLIAEGRTKPMIVVTPNATDLSFSFPVVTDAILNSILPYMEANYNISKDPAMRVMAGLSQGSRLTTYIMYQKPASFKNYCILSGGLPLKDVPVELYERPEVKDRKIFVAGGWYDQAFVRDESSVYNLEQVLASRKIPFISHMVFSGHTWTTWRQSLVFLLDNFLWK